MTNSFSIFKFKNFKVRIEASQSISPLKISLEKYKSSGWLSEFYTCLYLVREEINLSCEWWWWWWSTGRGIFAGRGGWADFWLMGGLPPYPPVGKTLNSRIFNLAHRVRRNINTLNKEETLFETNMELCNLRFEKIKISEEVTDSVIRKSQGKIIT